MILIKRSKLLNEIFFIGFLIYIFILITQGMRITGLTGFLPNKITIFEILKTYFFSISLLMIVEYFVAYDLPKNYLLSRLFGFFVMSTFTLIIFNLYSKTWIFNNLLAINLIYLSSIIIGSIAAYYIQRLTLNRSLILGIINYVIFASIFVITTIISPLGYIFEI